MNFKDQLHTITVCWHALLLSQALAQGDFQKAVMCVQRCKDMLMKLPKEVSEIFPSLSFQTLRTHFPLCMLRDDICHIKF